MTHSLQPPFSPDQPPARLLSGGRSPRSPSPVSRWGHRGQRQGLKGTISSQAPERPVLPPGAGGRGGLLPGVFFSLSSLPSVLSSSVSYCLSASFRLGRFSHCACLSACLSVCLSHQMSGWSAGSSPGMGGSGGGELGVGHPRTLVLTLITAGFLRGQDWVMVSLLPPQSDATLPGPARLEGEPQGDLMQAPGLPGSPVPQNVSTWHLGSRSCTEQWTRHPLPWGPPGICLVPSSSEQVPSDSKIQRVWRQASAYPFSLGLSQGRAVHLSELGHLTSRSSVPSLDEGFQEQSMLLNYLGAPRSSAADPVTLAQSRVLVQPLLTGSLPFVRPRSLPASAARHLCPTAPQRGHPRCPHRAPASHHQALSKSTAQPARARAPSGSRPQTSTPASALTRAQQAAPGASSRAAMGLSTHTSGISMRTSSPRPRPPWPSMDTPLRPRGRWRPSRRSPWMWGRLRPSCLASQQRPGATGSPTPAKSTAPKSW